MAVIESWLRQKRGTKVTIKVPRRGEKHDLLNMAIENAGDTLKRLQAEWEVDTNRHTEALTELQQALALPNPPARIECYDISNLQGTAVTASMVVFAKGVPIKGDYRRFRIKTVEGQDDFASMAEVLRRRFARARDVDAARSVDGKENRWAIMPDLIIIDGGKGQLHAARETLEEVGMSHLHVVSLAKQEEEIFVPGRPVSVLLPRDSQALYLVQRIRDEAHRFAITYHRQLRAKEGIRSILEEVPGIGPARRKALLKRFGSLEGVRGASLDELLSVPGMTRKAAEELKEYL